MPWTARQKIWYGFWLLTLAPLLLAIVTFRSASSLVDAAQDVQRTNDIVKRLENLLSKVKDLEVAEREYLLTGAEGAIGGIEESKRQIETGMAELRAARADGRWLELLEILIPQKLDEIRKSVEARRERGIEGALENSRPSGPLAMDDIRRVVRNMIAEENRQLAARSEAQNRQFIWTMVFFGLLLLLSVALIWSVFHLIRREDARMQAQHVELERRVALRTEELQRSNEDLQQFAYVASHDMKEPMRMISSYSTLLQRRYQGKLDGDADTYIGFIVDGVKRMNTLITDLLEYSRAGESKEEQSVEVDAEKILANVLANLKVTIADTRASVTHDALPRVIYDPVRLTQLLQNLIANAVKYRAKDRTPAVHVSAEARGSETVFTVRDNGMGIAREHQDQIFGIFKRLHGKEIEGTGIGLAMCKKIVERHGGTIWVESEPGKGSTFRFTIPHAQSAAAP